MAHTIETVRVVKNSSEPAPNGFGSVMTLYFEGRPTPKQILYTAKALAHAYRTRPNFNSPNLRFVSKPQGKNTRVQVLS